MRPKFINLNFWVKSLYVILIIGVYLIISPSSVTHCLFIGFKTPLWVMNKLSFSLSMDFFLPQHVIYGHFIHHSWKSRFKVTCSSVGNTTMLIFTLCNVCLLGCNYMHPHSYSNCEKDMLLLQLWKRSWKSRPVATHLYYL